MVEGEDDEIVGTRIKSLYLICETNSNYYLFSDSITPGESSAFICQRYHVWRLKSCGR